MNTAVPAVVNLDSHRITRGQLAWSRIKATAAEQRELWRQVGAALLVGRKLYRSPKMFGQWVEFNGFKDIDVNTRTDAMWLASFWNEVERVRLEVQLLHSDGEVKALTHPKNIRQHFIEYVRKVATPPELADLTITEKPTVTLDQRSAEKLAKVINRANSGDEGSETAKRHVESIAKRHGVSSEVLREVVSHAAPHTYFQFSPAQVESLQEFKGDLLGAYQDMIVEGFTAEQVIAIYMNVVEDIKRGI